MEDSNPHLLTDSKTLTCKNYSLVSKFSLAITDVIRDTRKFSEVERKTSRWLLREGNSSLRTDSCGAGCCDDSNGEQGEVRAGIQREITETRIVAEARGSDVFVSEFWKWTFEMIVGH